MKKMIMLGLIFLTCLGGHSVFAQAPEPNPRATITNTVMKGNMVRKFKKSGSSSEFNHIIETFVGPELTFDNRTKEWRIYTVVKATRDRTEHSYWPMWIKYSERTGQLVISTTEEKHNQWTLKKNVLIKVTIAGHIPRFKLEFAGNFEGTNDEGYNYNWMKGSWIEVTRSSCTARFPSRK